MPGSSGPSRWPRSTGSTGCSPPSSGSPQSGARRYHFVIVSDHGQSQGQVFADRYGIDLARPVRRR